MSIPIVLQILHHLLGGAFNPLRCLDARALVPPQHAEILRLGLDNAPCVVVGKWVLGVFRLGFWLVEVLGTGIAVAESPWVRFETADKFGFG